MVEARGVEGTLRATVAPTVLVEPNASPTSAEQPNTASSATTPPSAPPPTCATAADADGDRALHRTQWTRLQRDAGAVCRLTMTRDEGSYE